ncbi:MAG: hypothetical protein WAT23_17820, partial [Chromatiaceae bacterium]
RLRVIHFSQSYYGKEDKTLKGRLKERPALEFVLHWAAAGAKEWYARGTKGLPLPDEVDQVTIEHRAILDSVSQFVDQYALIDTETVDDRGVVVAFTVGKALYGSYRQWCEDEGYLPLGRKRFTAAMEMRGVRSVVKWVGDGAQRGYSGITLRALTPHPSPNGNGSYMTKPAPIDI